jgi:hypothetical protein
MLSLQFSPDDLTRIRFGVSQLSHLAFGVLPPRQQYVGASIARDRWWRQIRSAIPAKARPFLELIHADAELVPRVLAPPMAGRARTLTDELDAVLAALAADSRCIA